MSRYRLPRNLYRKTIYTIKDYDRLKARREEILSASPPPPDGQPKGGQAGDIVFRKAVRLADIDQQIKAIEEALERVPEEYRKGVWDHIQSRTPFPVDASMNTYKTWKQRFIYWVAVRMDWY